MTAVGRAAEGTGAAGRPAPVSAGLVTRLLAAAVDTAAVLLLAVGADLVAAGARFAWSPSTFRWPSPTTGVTSLVLLFVAVGYLTLAWVTTGRTYGQRLLGLRLVTVGHRLLGPVRAVLRALACALLPLGLLWCGVSPDRRSLHDLLFRTVVVYDTQPYAGAADT